MEYKTKACLQCGKEYQPTGQNQKFCPECKPLTIAARGAAWRKANPERVKAIGIRCRIGCPEKHRARVAKWQTENPERMREFSVQWRKNNPEAVRLSSSHRRALLYGNTPIADLLTEAQWRDILDQYHHRCAYCGKKSDGLTMDHVIPLSRGGKHSADNVVPACLHCNCSKGTKTTEERFGIKMTGQQFCIKDNG